MGTAGYLRPRAPPRLEPAGGSPLARLVLADLLGEGLGGVPPEHDRRAGHPPPDIQQAGHPAPCFLSGELAAEHCQGVVRCGLRAGMIVH